VIQKSIHTKAKGQKPIRHNRKQNFLSESWPGMELLENTVSACDSSPDF